MRRREEATSTTTTTKMIENLYVRHVVSYGQRAICWRNILFASAIGAAPVGHFRVFGITACWPSSQFNMHQSDACLRFHGHFIFCRLFFLFFFILPMHSRRGKHCFFYSMKMKMRIHAAVNRGEQKIYLHIKANIELLQYIQYYNAIVWGRLSNSSLRSSAQCSIARAMGELCNRNRSILFSYSWKRNNIYYYWFRVDSNGLSCIRHQYMCTLVGSRSAASRTARTILFYCYFGWARICFLFFCFFFF